SKPYPTGRDTAGNSAAKRIRGNPARRRSSPTEGRGACRSRGQASRLAESAGKPKHTTTQQLWNRCKVCERNTEDIRGNRRIVKRTYRGWRGKGGRSRKAHHDGGQNRPIHHRQPHCGRPAESRKEIR